MLFQMYDGTLSDKFQGVQFPGKEKVTSVIFIDKL